MDILYLLTIGTLNIVCFFIGAKVGQTVAKGEKIEVPNLNPIKAAEERASKRAAKEEQDKMDVIMQNIERYDGTAQGQKDVPRG